MLIAIIGSKSLASLIEVQGDSATRNEKERIHACVRAVSFQHAETFLSSLKQP